MDIYATDKIFVVDAIHLTLEIYIVDEVIRRSKYQQNYLEVSNEEISMRRISMDSGFNVDLNTVISYEEQFSHGGVFSFTDEKIAKQALVIFVKQELDNAEKQLEEYKMLFHQTFDRVSQLQTQYNSLTKV